jgi:hypothetical protein
MPRKYEYVGRDRYLYTTSGLLIAKGFERIVHGGRGDYVEISGEDMVFRNIEVPIEAEWRLDREYVNKIYYVEYRSTCPKRVKIYHQVKPVDYADYKVGYFYISPKELKDFCTR